MTEEQMKSIETNLRTARKNLDRAILFTKLAFVFVLISLVLQLYRYFG